jgi:imidazolonepropionase-like amidohydrolase
MAGLRTVEFGLTSPGPRAAIQVNSTALIIKKAVEALHQELTLAPEHGHRFGIEAINATNPGEAIKFVAARIADGAEYIKIMIEEGTVLKAPGLPMLADDTLLTAVNEAHPHSKLAVVHALTAAATEQAIAAGIDGLTHVFLDQPHTPELTNAIASSGDFVNPCLVLNSSIMGHAPSAFASDHWVSSKLSPN